MAFLLSTLWPGRKRISVCVRSLVLIDVADDLLDRGQAGVGLGRGLLRHLGLVAGVNRVLVGFGGLGRGQADAFLGARIGVLDHLGVRGRQLVQFVDAVTDGRGLPLHIFLAGKGIDLAPEALMRVGLQSGLAAGAGSGGSGLVLRGVERLLRQSGKRQHTGQKQRYKHTILHFYVLQVGEHRAPLQQ